MQGQIVIKSTDEEEQGARGNKDELFLRARVGCQALRAASTNKPDNLGSSCHLKTWSRLTPSRASVSRAGRAHDFAYAQRVDK